MFLNNKMKPLLILAAFLASAGFSVPAQSSDFYQGKQIRVVIGLGAGSTYDAYARTLTRHMGKHIPGRPGFVNVNMPGAGSLTAFNHIASAAPKDGTVFGTGHRFLPIMSLFDSQGLEFDGTTLEYIGSANREVGVAISWHTSNITTLQDLLERELIVGTTGRGASLTNFASVLQRALGARLRVIAGYSTTREIDLAVERGEIQGRAGVSWNSIVNAQPAWISENRINVLIQMGLNKHPDLPDVPNLLDLVTDPLDKAAIELLLAPSEMGRPFIAPQGVPADRLALLRAGFDATMADSDFLADAAKQNMEINPMNGAEMAALISGLYKASSPEVVDRARRLTAAGFDATIGSDGASGSQR